MNKKSTIIAQWASVQAPPPPELKAVTVDLANTALVIMDIQKQNCTREQRPRCVESLPKIQGLLSRARQKGMTVIYTLTRNADVSDFLKEVAPVADEPVVKSGVDKFFNTDLNK